MTGAVRLRTRLFKAAAGNNPGNDGDEDEGVDPFRRRLMRADRSIKAL